ncbi:apolipoprotein N-acyltransferase [Falsiroseomonas bella]|uniref:Apolipoprotein N-acyltransferase n=1 Tax=Falsiroseomonas bella TaxID=2184016 RepID=A0A317FKX2_9PROT|nr:apolipoprotein N-acyltransferase [Falsiroseomonas bella]PWS38609.1 apolipoprotein N-acyltransferase [Falsiroseomonas bella]
MTRLQRLLAAGRARLTRHLAGPGFWRALFLAFALGAITALALPPVHAVPVLLLTLPGLFVMATEAPTRWRAAWIGLAWGWGFHIAGLHWLTSAILTEVERYWWLVPIAVPALALPLGAFTVIPALGARLAAPGWPRMLAFAAAWTAAEMLRGVLFTGFPWNLLGTVWAFGALPIQAAAWIGVHGLSLATALLVLLPLLGRRGWLAGGALLAGFAAIGLLRLWPVEPEPQPVSLVLVQGNVAQDVKWRPETRWPIFRRYIELSHDGVELARAEAPQNRVLVVWPETASPFLLTSDAEAARLATQPLPPEGLLLAGTVRAAFDAEGRPTRLWNSMAALAPGGRVLEVVDKTHLVPFGEYMPLRGLLPVRLVHGAADFTSGGGLRAVRLPGLPSFTGLICYEVIFPGAVTPAERPGFLVNITNDAWFGISAGPWQHLAAARMRAVEEGLPLVRAAQTGISAVIDARGRTVARMGLAETGVVVAPLPRSGAPTPFARWGIAIPLVLLGALSILAGSAAIFETRITRR